MNYPQDSSTVSASACGVNSGVEVQAATTKEQIAQCQQWLGAEHFLGPARTAGERLFQIAFEGGTPVAVLAWAASAWHLKDRDDWIGWDPLTRACRLKLVVSNWRFLVFEETRRPNLASACLGAALRALPGQWYETHGYRPLLAESFTDPESHAGTCYKASNWIPLGFSKGFARHYGDYYVPNDRPKKLWVYELHPEPGKAREVLCSRRLPAEHAPAETDGAGVRCVLKADQLRSLVEVFRQIPDPRSRGSMRYPLPAVLTIIALALLGGAVHISEICRAGQRLSQKQRQQIGLRQKRGKRFWPAPSYGVYRDLLLRLDHAEMARLFNTWLGEHQGVLPRSLAMDGKTIVHQLGQTLSIVDQSDGVPVAVVCNDEGDELPAAQKLLQSGQVSLLNAVVGADALHCQDNTAREIVNSGGDYMLRVKGNQPEVFQRAKTLLDPADAYTRPLFPQSPRKATDA